MQINIILFVHALNIKITKSQIKIFEKLKRRFNVRKMNFQQFIEKKFLSYNEFVKNLAELQETHF